MKKERNILVKRSYTPPQENRDEHYLHMNDTHELYMLLDGDVSFNIDGRNYHMEPYDVLLISNQEIHCVMVDHTRAYERVRIYFWPDCLRQYCTKNYNLLRFFNGEGNVKGSNKIGHEIIQKYGLDKDFLRMNEFYEARLPERDVQLMCLLLKMLLNLNRAYEENSMADNPEGKNYEQNEKVEDIIRYISENLSKRLTLDDLTKKFYLSKYYLCREFKRVTGFTVFDYIRYKRVLTAKTKLQNGQPINEVWRELGYVDYSNFYRIFKKISGMSPREYVDNEKKRQEDERETK